MADKAKGKEAEGAKVYEIVEEDDEFEEFEEVRLLASYTNVWRQLLGTPVSCQANHPFQHFPPAISSI
jgi:hypothetical protein